NNIPMSTYTIFKPYLLNALLSTETKVVIIAVESLVQMMDDEVEGYLLSVLGKNEAVDSIILGNLQNTGKAFVLLAERYESSAFDQKKNVMGFIMPRIREISETNDKEMMRVRASLFDALAIDWADSDEEMRLLMVDALFYLDEERAFAFFAQLIDGSETWMRITTLEMVGSASHGRTTDLLVKFSNDDDLQVRECVHAVLNSRGLMTEDTESTGAL
ncbi:MAG: hypothetical protein WCI84_07775, partial [Bacteroidota bacterium]